MNDFEQEEEACWVILEKELQENTPYVEVVISVDALVVEVPTWI